MMVLSWASYEFIPIYSKWAFNSTIGVPTLKDISSDLAGWWIFQTIFHDDFKNVNSINIGHTPSTHSCPQIGPNSNQSAHAKFDLGRLFGLIGTSKNVFLKFFIDGPFSKLNFYQEIMKLKMAILAILSYLLQLFTHYTKLLCILSNVKGHNRLKKALERKKDFPMKGFEL